MKGKLFFVIKKIKKLFIKVMFGSKKYLKNYKKIFFIFMFNYNMKKIKYK